MRNASLIAAAAILLAIVAFSFFSRSPVSAPQQKTYRIGILVRGSGYEAAVEGYRRKMHDLGYQEGKNAAYDIRFVSAREELPKAVAEFLASGVDLIHTYSTPATQVAYDATRDLIKPVPVVFGSVGDPLIAGVVKDLRRSGTNVTGVSSLSTELTARRLELLKEINPRITRVVMPHTAAEAGDVAANTSVEIAKETAAGLGIKLILLPVRSKEDNNAVARSIQRRDAEGMIVGGDSLVWGSIELYIAQAIQEKIPFAAFDVSQVRKGALMGFGPDYTVAGEQAALLSHQILRGRPVAEMPVEVPRKLLLTVNQKTARAIGVVLGKEFLGKADVIISE